MAHRNGNRNCRVCNGSGVRRVSSGYIVCSCVRGNSETRSLHRQANAQGAQDPTRSLVRQRVEQMDKERNK